MGNSCGTDNRILFILHLFFPLVLYAVPLEDVLTGESICLFKLFTGRECYGCGMGRAFFSFIHLDFKAAWEYHPMIFIVAPLLAYIYFKSLLRIWKRLRN